MTTEDMNAQQTVKELRKAGKVAILMDGALELEVFADKSDLISQIEYLGKVHDSDYLRWDMVDKGTHRTLYFTGYW